MNRASYESELERSGSITITTHGVSMRPLFHTGSDAVIVQKCAAASLKNLDIVLFIRPGAAGEEYVLHRIVGRQPDGNFIIAGDNCVTADIVPPDRILGRAVSAQRRNQPIPLNGIRYGVYKWLWCAPYSFRFKVLRIKHRLGAAVRKIVSRRRG